MLNRSTIFLGLMLTGTLAAATLVSGDDSGSSEVADAVISRHNDFVAHVPEKSLLQLGRLVRDGVDDPVRDPFAGKTWYVPPPPPPPVPIANIVQEVIRPTAPSLPFKFIAWMREEDGHEIAYLSDGNRVISANKGDILNGTYKVNSIAQKQIDLVYLPMDVHQTLAVDGENAMGNTQSVSINSLSIVAPAATSILGKNP